MRDIIQDIEGTIKKVSDAKGTPLIIRVNRGRNRIDTLEGCIEDTYHSIFTFRNAAGDLSSFSYNDIMNRNILFFRKK